MFYMMGSALEQHWGVFRYNFFLFVGWLLTVLVAFLFPGSYATNLFLAGSVFLAFAFLNPDFELLHFFILPVKIKWLALLQWILYGYSFLKGPWPIRLAVLASMGNFLMFFTGEIIQRMKSGRRHMEYQAKQAAARENDEPRHRCVVCGKNDRTHPMEDFRYGDDDRTVSVQGSRSMVARAKDLGIDVTYVEVPGGSHSGVVAPNLPGMFEFFNAHKKGGRTTSQP